MKNSVKRYTYVATTFILLLAMPPMVNSSNIGVPIIKNYPKEAYNAGLQNWDIGQDQYGRMYFANNEGLLIYDGSTWKLHQVENKTIVRSLLIHEDRIYVGSQGDFGYFKPDRKGALTYFSLKDKVPETFQSFGDVWKITKNKESVLFRTTNKVFSFDRDSVKVFFIDKDFAFVNEHDEKVYLHKLENPPPHLKDAQYQLLSSSPVLQNAIINGITTLGAQSLITTLKNGLFRFNNGIIKPWQTNDKGFFKEHRINCSVQIDDERIAIGTLSGGLFIIDSDGNVLQHLNINKGLQSNEVMDVFKDGAGNLWLALSNGIDYVEINASFSKIKPDNNIGGTGYAVKIHNGKIYFGTSNGLYVADWKNYYNPLEDQPFKYVENTKGQVWALEVYKDKLLLGHHEGAFSVEQDQATLISAIQGAWNFISMQDEEDLLLEGTYEGLNLLSYDEQHWSFESRVENMINESCRFLVQDADHNIWVAHPYRGVYRIVLDVEKHRIDSIKLYNTGNGFHSDWVHVFKIGDGVVFTSTQGIYDYDQGLDSFLLSEKWAEVIAPKSHVQRLIEDDKGDIWFVIDNEVGVIKIQDLGIDKRLKKEVFPELTKKLVGGFEYIYPYDAENVFFPVEQGFIHFNPQKYGLLDTLFQLHMQEVKLGDSTVIYGGWRTNEWELPIFKHNHNSFSFHYSVPIYSEFNKVEFQYFLRGLDEAWSPWMTKNTKEYTALSSGSYEFQVRAKNSLGQITEIESFSFEILPPWYISTIAKAIYFFITILGLLALIFIPRRKFEKEKIILKQEQEKKLDRKTKEYEKIVAQNHAEILELQQEKLKTEIQFKNQELATSTMHLVQKSELISKLKGNLNHILRKSREPEVKKEIRATILLLDQNAQLDETWEQFSKYFDQVHVDFLKRLQEAYPHLTPKDQKLCTYLRMNLSTKEIVPLMNISVRGVEVSRYRLRKKLDLDSTINLNEFMMKF